MPVRGCAVTIVTPRVTIVDIRRADEKLADQVGASILRSNQTVASVAEASGLTLDELTKSLRAERPLSVADLLGIAGALDVPFISLIEGATA